MNYSGKFKLMNPMKSLTQPVLIARISESGGVLLIVPVELSRAVPSPLEHLRKDKSYIHSRDLHIRRRTPHSSCRTQSCRPFSAGTPT